MAITTAFTSASEFFQLDGITYLWRHRRDIPTFYSHAPMCIAANKPGWAGYEGLGGMLAKSVTQGKPQGYDAAMRLPGFTLPQ
jgi:hypothetical protein